MGRIFLQIVSHSRLKFFSFGEKMLAGLLGLYCKCSKDKFYKKLVLWKNAIFVVKRNFSQRFWTSGEKTQQAYDHFILSSRWSFYGDSCHKVKKLLLICSDSEWENIAILVKQFLAGLLDSYCTCGYENFQQSIFMWKEFFFIVIFWYAVRVFWVLVKKTQGCFKFFLSVQMIELTKNEFFEDWYVSMYWAAGQNFPAA